MKRSAGKLSDQQVLQNWQWLYSEGYKRGYADAKADKPNQTAPQSETSECGDKV